MEANLTAKADQLARELATGATTIDDLNALPRGLMKSALQRMLDTEMDAHLGRRTVPATPDVGGQAPADACRNRRNGYPPKAVQGETGEIPWTSRATGRARSTRS
jgi:transposase-like protein